LKYVINCATPVLRLHDDIVDRHHYVAEQSDRIYGKVTRVFSLCRSRTDVKVTGGM